MTQRFNPHEWSKNLLSSLEKKGLLKRKKNGEYARAGLRLLWLAMRRGIRE